MAPGRNPHRPIVWVVFVISVPVLSAVFYRLDIGPGLLSPPSAPGGGALVAGMLAATVPAGAAWLTLRSRDVRGRRQRQLLRERRVEDGPGTTSGR